MTLSKTAALAAVVIALLAAPSSAQQPTGSDSSGTTPQPPASTSRDDAALNLAQPDFTLIALPTSLRMPKGKFAFRVTHRFLRSWGEGDFGDLANDFFGLDNGAITALELRYGLLPGTQIGVHRSALGKNISFFAEHDVIGQDRAPLAFAVWASIDGTNNFRDSYSPAVGAIFSRELMDKGAIYIEPIYVNNSNPLSKEETLDDNDTVILGLGTRLRIGAATYVVVEWSPRVAGYKPNVDAVGFGIEKRVGGHMFQLNWSNQFATTMGQVARGAFTNDDWYFGFNLSRKFF